MVGEFGHCLGECCGDLVCAVPIGEVEQQGVVSDTFDQGPDRRRVVLPGDQVTFPVPWDTTVSDFFITLNNVDHVGDLPTRVSTSRPALTTPRPWTNNSR